MSDSWPAGSFWWVGNTCLLSLGEDASGSHDSKQVAVYDEATRTSHCPDCGALVLWAEPPEAHDDPRCSACRNCPPTVRSGDAHAAGGSSTPADAGGRTP